MKQAILAVLAAGATFALAPGAHAAGDPNRGSKVFQEECSDCHSATAGKNKKGPSLAGVIGRKAGSVPDFNYSDAMRASGIVWAADKIEPYITRPKQIVPSGKMKYDGLDDEQARQDIISYLMILR